MLFFNDLHQPVQPSLNKAALSQWSASLWTVSLLAYWLLEYYSADVLLCFSCVEKWLTSVFAFVAANWQGDKLHVAQGSVVMMS